ncbi:MAG: transcription elongation factor GreA [Acidimicrobiia bacterium]
MTLLHHLSRHAHERLTAEFEQLTTVGRIEIAQAIERAREMGDLSENGDYQAAKDQQGMMEARIRQIQAILKDAVIVETSDDGVVRPGTVVTIVYDGDSEDDAETYLVGHIEEKRDGIEVITPGSPLGEALIDHREGDEVSYDVKGNQLKVKILAVEQ